MLKVALNALGLGQVQNELGVGPVLIFRCRAEMEWRAFAESGEKQRTGLTIITDDFEDLLEQVESDLDLMIWLACRWMQGVPQGQMVLFERPDLLVMDEAGMALLGAFADYAERRGIHLVFLVAGLEEVFPVVQPLVMSGRAVIYDENGENLSLVVGPNTLYVQMFGYPFVFHNGRRITQWDGTLPRHLFYYFVDHPMVTRDEIFAVYWPNMSIKEATNVFHVTKRKISERVGHEVTNYTSGFYVRPDDLAVVNPVADFEVALAVAREGVEPESWLKWYEAARLYRGQFLDRPDCDMPWMNERRDQLANDQATACHQWARVLLDPTLGVWPEVQGQDRLQMACNWFLRAFAANPAREDSALEALYLLRELRDKDGSKRVYKNLVDFLRTLRMQPAKLHTRVYAEIVAQKD